MKFCDTLHRLRTEQGFTQAELAKASGIALKTISNYENGNTTPRTLDLYEKLAETLHCEVRDLLTDNEIFKLKAQRRYGARGKAEAKQLVKRLTGLFAGGEIAPEDMEEMALAVQEAYFIAKQNNQKYASLRENSLE